MNNSVTDRVQANAIQLWTPRTIGWATLIFGIASGFFLAIINWHRMGNYQKARWNLLLGILVAIFFAEILYPSPGSSIYLVNYIVRLLIYLVMVFLVIAYLHTQMRKDIGAYKNERPIQDASALQAILISIAVLVSIYLIRAGLIYLAQMI